MGKCHLNLFTDVSNESSCTKREMIEEANEQMFVGISGWHRDYETQWSFLQGHDREFNFVVKHELLMGTSEAPRFFTWSFDKTFKR